MGLAEKRMIKELVETVVPRYEAELLEITGTPIEYKLDWENFLDKLPALQGLEDKGFKVISAGMRLICRDDIGKEAVAEKLHMIELSQWNSNWSNTNLNEYEKTLNISWDWGGDERFTPEMFEETVSTML